MRKLQEFLNKILQPSSPTQPAASTFGAEASHQADQQARTRDFDNAVAVEKGRTNRGMGG